MIGFALALLLVCNLWGVFVVLASLAGMFSAFFHRRGQERNPQHAHPSS